MCYNGCMRYIAIAKSKKKEYDKKEAARVIEEAFKAKSSAEAVKFINEYRKKQGLGEV